MRPVADRIASSSDRRISSRSPFIRPCRTFAQASERPYAQFQSHSIISYDRRGSFKWALFRCRGLLQQTHDYDEWLSLCGLGARGVMPHTHPRCLGVIIHKCSLFPLFINPLAFSPSFRTFSCSLWPPEKLFLRVPLRLNLQRAKEMQPRSSTASEESKTIRDQASDLALAEQGNEKTDVLPSPLAATIVEDTSKEVDPFMVQIDPSDPAHPRVCALPPLSPRLTRIG